MVRTVPTSQAYNKTEDLKVNRARIAVATVLVAALAACGSAHPAHVSASGKTAAQHAAQQLTRKCIPADTARQVRLIHSLATKAGRQALAVKCGIPPANRPAVEAQILNAAEHGHLNTHAGRAAFITVTLPAIISRGQS